MIRAGSGEPLVLLHGVTGSERMWSSVVPLLAPHHDTVAVTALGHRGGKRAARHRLVDMVDDAERQLDELGFEHAHLAGNSMGGWIALELARRGRARTVCALSPAGCWHAGQRDQRHPLDKLRRIMRTTELSRPLLPLVVWSRRVRRIALRENAVHGDRLSAQQLLDLTDDLLGCSARRELLLTAEELAPLDPTPCPIVLAWSGRDRIFPPQVHGVRARELVPGATYLELPDVGHVPMFDDPLLVAQAILKTTQLQRSASAIDHANGSLAVAR